MRIEVKNGDQQHDFKEGCIEIQTVDPKQCFERGNQFRILCYNGYECVEGEYGQGKFIRIPLVKKEKP